MASDFFEVPQVQGKLDFVVDLPGSKSITNRVLLIAALADRPVELSGVLFSDDSRHLLDCLQRLGFRLELATTSGKVTVTGLGGEVPCRKAVINVGSSGTASRFLTALLAMTDGEYFLEASAQMASRPMKPLLTALKQLGAGFKYLGQPDCLPYRIDGTTVRKNRVSLESGVSSQFLSALLLTGCRATNGLEIKTDGSIAAKPYIEMTLIMMREFGVTVENHGFQSFYIPKGQSYRGIDYQIEPDLSNAGYFWAMAALTGGAALVRGAKLNSIQGDVKFLKVLEQLGCKVGEQNGGIRLEGPAGGVFPGIEADLGDTPDQTMTLAALAPFAAGPTVIKNVGVIKYHESNRLRAIAAELTRLGISCEETTDGLIIQPGRPRPAEIETYDDHRMAMAFSLIGLRTPGIRIKNPGCVGKTFEGYFDYLKRVVTGEFSK